MFPPNSADWRFSASRFPCVRRCRAGQYGHRIEKDLRPLFEREICRQRKARGFVALRDHLGE